MPVRSDLSAALAAHLEFYRDLGVDGISRDPRWAQRAASAGATPASDHASPDETTSPVVNPDPATAVDEHSSSSESVVSQRPVRDVRWTPPAASMFDEPVAKEDGPPRETAVVLREIREDIGDCTRCKLHGLGRKQIVFGVGNPQADLMFVGEAPGRDEDIQGEPFVGRAGQLLTKIIEAIGLKREDVYIANVIKCRPPENRNPEPDEVASCEPFLFRQVDAIKPKVIVALGTFAAHALLKTQASISKLRGREFQYRGATLIPTFHPAFLLRSPERKRDTWEDMKKVRAILQGDELS